MSHYRVPGLSLALIDDFEISWARGYGTMDGDRPVTPATLFQTASIGKPVVAAVALHLVETGALDLDEDVNAKLTSWRIPGNEFTARTPVTLRHLLSHSGGVTVSGFRGYPRTARLPTLVQILDGRLPANSAPIRVDSLPGKAYRYSGGGYLIVQQLVTDVTRRPFDDVVQATVFEPLGMNDSVFDPLPGSCWNRAATGHRPDGQPVEGGWHVYPEHGAGPFWSTPTDLARFGIELMRAWNGSSNRLLSQTMAREMLTVQPVGFGLGISVNDDGGDRFYGMHWGANEGYRSLIVLYPKRGEGAVIMTNSDTGDPLTRELLRAISREYGWVSGLILKTWMLVLGAAVMALVGGWVWLRIRRARHL